MTRLYGVWDSIAEQIDDARTFTFDCRVNRSYPIVDARTTASLRSPARPLIWTRIRGPISSGLPRTFGFVKYPKMHDHEVDDYHDGRSVYLDDRGMYLSQGRVPSWPFFWLYSLHAASFHPWGEWDGSPGGDVASRIPSWPLVDPFTDTALALGLGPELIRANEFVEPAQATDVRRPDPGGDDRGLVAPDGVPMGARLLLVDDVEPFMDRTALDAADFYDVMTVLMRLRTFGGIVMNTTTHGGTIIAPHLSNTATAYINDALRSSSWTEAKEISDLT